MLLSYLKYYRVPQVILSIYILTLTACSGEGGTGGLTGGNNNSGTSPTTTGQPLADPPNSESFLVMTASDELIRISATTGQSRTLYELPCCIDFNGPATLIGDKVVVTADDNTLNVIDVNTGQYLWEFWLGLDEIFGADVEAYCAPDICYAIGTGGDLFAVDVESQRSLWSHSFLAGPGLLGVDSQLTQSIMIADDRVYVVGNYEYEQTSSLTIMNRFTGEVALSFELNDYAWASPRLVGSILVVPTARSLRAYDNQSMRLLWETDFNGLNFGLYGTSPVAVAGNVIAFDSFVETNGDDFFDERRLVAVDINSGAILWTVNSGDADGFRFNPESDGVNFYGAVTEYGNVGGFRTKQGRPFAVNAQSGQIVWKSPENGINITAKDSPLAAAGLLYFTDAYHYNENHDQHSGMVVVDARNGASIMLANMPTIYQSPPIMVHNNKVIRPQPWPGYTQSQ